MAASHIAGKSAPDKIFGAAAAANAAKAKFGKENVLDATIGAMFDNSEKLAVLPTVEKVYKSLPMTDIVPYAGIAGQPDFLEMVQVAAFGDNRPEAYTKAVSTSGGSGAIHHAVWNYSEIGDTILTHDWYWDPYSVLSDALLRKLDTFAMFDAADKFNVKSLESKVNELLAKQTSLLLILNTPAHNPVGYSLNDAEWDQVIEVLKKAAKPGKKITLLVDIAYLDYAGEKNATRAFMKKFGGLPENILVVVAYSMSKGYTVYGMRTGAMIGISSSQAVITEFADVNQYMSRATWSNINRGAQQLLTAIYKDAAAQADLEKERAVYYKMMAERAELFAAEAKAAKLAIVPYIAGFFLSIPAKDSGAVCLRLHEDNIFGAPLAKGVRLAVCAMPLGKIKGVAAKIAKAMAEVDK
jgi:aromatic-amino-acid transaminase